ncbi:Re/Si-specific NAD(P)(+) transhydrogenase subunit alpha [Phytoactinopolyspora halotolerans]|uniref:proton-translocating NAD(P)(+) transhydrogenase n=1 Tax=Phytoactinopolyspora halotolerans TaxID=1981512 RepID=A0A6L9S3U4_9ACTN|nr:Re/Si-specific NAD(P)(+) transhydrogenase subunit alpha [Phytoactinopolyspora halotolerans]NED99271.1 Re/Si-specific NAD(P)(+) transhydrogenase subunit alpha [Phytoactinopolyspora halotolerans]
MRVAVVRETRPQEKRVALVPELVGRLTGAGLDVVVETGAGLTAFHTDDAYRDAGADVRDDVLEGSDVILSVQPLDPVRVANLKPGAITLSFIPTASELEFVRQARDAGVTACAMELVPRISRAQSMDALTSQALVAGYRAVLVAAERLPRFFPLSMTAAGTVPPAQALVLGAGVAGLQAIATARRLGARVDAYDVRAASAEEIRSLGARFVELDLPSLEGAGGYAREMTEERAQQQRDLLAPYVTAADVVITTAAVPGRSAPLLVERDAVEAMKPGSVVVDLAAESGGNVEGSRPGEELTVGQTLLWGGANVPSQLPVHASRLYAANLVNLILLMTSEGEITVDLDDEIIDGVCVTHDGTVRHEPTRASLEEEG